MSFTRSYSPGAGVVVFTWSLLLLLCNSVASVLFTRRIFTFPIQGRQPELVLINNVLMSIHQVRLVCRFLLYASGLDSPCAFEQLSFYFPSGLMATVYCLRVWMLMFRYNIADHLAGPNAKQSNWYVQHRTWISPISIRNGLVWDSALLLLVAILGLGLDTHLQSVHDCPEHWDHWMTTFALVNVAIRCFFVMTMTTRISKTHHEEFFIESELRATVFGLVSGLLVYVVVVATVSKSTVWHYFLVDLFALFAFSLILGTSTIYPWYKSCTNHNVTTNDDQVILNFLHSEDGFNAFLSFLKREFATENLLFWKAVEDYRGVVQSQEQMSTFESSHQFVKDNAVQIMDMYIYENAPAQINISYQDRMAQFKAFESAFESKDRQQVLTFLDKSQTSVFELFKDGAWHRFKDSHEYKRRDVSGVLSPTTPHITIQTMKLVRFKTVPVAILVVAIALFIDPIMIHHKPTRFLYEKVGHEIDEIHRLRNEFHLFVKLADLSTWENVSSVGKLSMSTKIKSMAERFTEDVPYLYLHIVSLHLASKMILLSEILTMQQSQTEMFEQMDLLSCQAQCYLDHLTEVVQCLENWRNQIHGIYVFHSDYETLVREAQSCWFDS